MTQVTFKRGATFAYRIEIPSTFADGYFASWEVYAQLRQAGNDQEKGLIANLTAEWDSLKTTRYVLVGHPVTEHWPLGEAEMDILFISSDGYRLRSETIRVTIERGITR